MEWRARWIWDAGEASPRNRWQCFRRSFDLPSDGARSAALAITADARYVAWLNGQLVGRGPARSWPSRQMYDTYEVGYLLRPGANILAVLVLHFGVSTFAYIRGRGGLLAQLDIQGKVIATDASWRTIAHPGYDSRAPRISVQQGFAERFDARACGGDWREAAFDDSSWPEATELGPVGIALWTEVVPRDIPPLTEERVQPTRVASLHRIKPVSITSVIDLRAQFLPDKEDNSTPSVYAGCVATLLRMAAPTRVTIGVQDAWTVPLKAIAVNGRRFRVAELTGSPPQRFLQIDVVAGDNWLVFQFAGKDFGLGFQMGVDAPIPISLHSPLGEADSSTSLGMTEQSPFVAIGPFAMDVSEWADAAALALEKEPDDREGFHAASTVASPDDLALFGDQVRAIPPQLVAPDDVFARFAWTSSRTKLPVPVALHGVAAGIPVDVPLVDSEQTEFVVDFGREYSGYLTFEVEAPAGTVIDLYGYEYEDETEGWRQDTFCLDNTLRYTCRQGRQQYTSVVRRGFRYLAVAVREASGPVRFHEIAVFQSNFPIAEVGRFRCSDPLLDQIWEISQHTTRLCMEDTFVDCPAYEQTFWVGDSRNEALVSDYAFGAEALTRRCLKLVPGSGAQTPFYNSQVPSGWVVVLPNWTFLWVIACFEHFQRTGDAEFAREIWPDVASALDQFLACRNDDGLLAIAAWNLLDWAPMDQPNDGVVTHQNCFLVAALRAASQLEEIATGQTSGRFQTAADELRGAINQHLWSDEQGAYLDTIHVDGRRSTIFSVPTQVTAYHCGVAKGERAARVEELFTEPAAGFVPIGSPFMSFFHYEALAKAGRFDVALADMRAHYGGMLARGATTCWEMYANTTINRANPAFPSRSHCHAWSAGPVYFLGAHVLGVRPLTPGWTEVAVEPIPCDLTWATGSVPLPREGTVDVAWSLDPEAHTMRLRISAPKGITVHAKLPDGFTGTSEVDEV
ncbi:MAG: family 78 glycoside hydrolase catalytic domain [Thermomicrobiales bacterium]